MCSLDALPARDRLANIPQCLGLTIGEWPRLRMPQQVLPVTQKRTEAVPGWQAMEPWPQTRRVAMLPFTPPCPAVLQRWVCAPAQSPVGVNRVESGPPVAAPITASLAPDGCRPQILLRSKRPPLSLSPLKRSQRGEGTSPASPDLTAITANGLLEHPPPAAIYAPPTHRIVVSSRFGNIRSNIPDRYAPPTRRSIRAPQSPANFSQSPAVR